MKSEKCDILSSLYNRFAIRAERVDEGRNRSAMVFHNYVVKVPKNFSGIIDNGYEMCATDEHFARTRSFVVRTKSWTVPILFMERVFPATDEEIIERLGKLPEWVSKIEKHQVGFSKNGKLLAYDFGIL